MRKTVFSVILIAVCYFPVSAQISDQKNGLRQLVLSAVEFDLDKDIEKKGFTERQARTDIELKLRQAGIVFDAHDRNSDSYPQLLIGARLIKSDYVDLYAYAIKISVITLVNAEIRAGKPPRLVFAIVWEREESGLIGIDRTAKVRGMTKDFADEFINDYLSVNPRIHKPDDLDRLLESLPGKAKHP